MQQPVLLPKFIRITTFSSRLSHHFLYVLLNSLAHCTAVIVCDVCLLVPAVASVIDVSAPQRQPM